MHSYVIQIPNKICEHLGNNVLNTVNHNIYRIRMIIQIDVREAELIKSCTFLISSMPCFKDLQLEIITLPIGDIIICDDIPSETMDNEKTHVEYLIIERKSLKDLCASIKDGRYEEQSYRLNGLPHHNHNIVYLIEGSMDKINMFKGIQEKIILYSSMVSINYFKGFSLWRSQHIEESALIICNAAYKIAKGVREQKSAHYKYVAPTVKPQIVVEETTITPPSETTTPPETPSPTIPAPSNEELLDTIANEKQYCSVVKKVKKENVTVNNIGEIILCQIPGVSTVTALAVLSAFKTLPMLIAGIQKDNTCLNNVTYVTSTGQTRKISKACIENIIKYLGQ
jgi:ERCC4-type nuclease